MSKCPDSELGTPKKNFDDTFSAETVLLEWLAVPEVKVALHRKPGPPDFLDADAISKTLK